jgi:predicted PurR-regulated permease PerM
MPANLTYLRSVAMLVTAVLVLGLVYWLQPLLRPIALAVLLSFLLSPIVTWLQRYRIPRTVAVVALVLTVSALLGGFGWLLERQMTSLVDSFPQYEENLDAKIASLHTGNAGLLEKLQRIAKRITGQLQKTEVPERPVVAEKGRAPLAVKVVSERPERSKRTK